MISQMTRAASSIPSNIAEGFRRRYSNEFRQFLHMSLGSIAELETQITIAQRLGYIDKTREETFLGELDKISRMTMGLIKKL